MRPTTARPKPSLSSPVHTWYLLLRYRMRERPTIIKQCQAAAKEQAASLFAARLNRLAAGELYTASELLAVIKRADELTDEEQRWIRMEDPALMAL